MTAPRLKIAITGASGFLGRCVIKQLLGQRVSIVAVTRNKANLSDFLGKIDIVEFDLCNVNQTTYNLLGKPDVLLHLAWDGLPNYNSLHHFDSELPRQYNFLRAMVAGGLASLVVVGTCFEYGMQSGSLSETIETVPTNPYGYAKDALQKQLNYLKKNSHFNLTWARLFYVYGEGQSTFSLLSQLKKAIDDKETYFNMSGGEQLRDYLSVHKATNYLVALLFKQQDIGIINICSGKPQSVRSLVETWIADNQWDIRLNLGVYDYPSYEPLAFWGDQKKLNKVLEC